MTLRVLMFGRTGQVAGEVLRQAGPELAVTALGRAEADLSDPASCARAVEAYDADVILNAAAYTAVDRAEDEEELATAVNATAPGIMARAAAGRGLPFLHISTDYVFDGSKEGAWTEEDEPAPVSAYGRSKLAGERAVAEAGGDHAVLRTSWVHSGHGTNFVGTMLRVGAARPRLTVVDDQHGGPTPAGAIAATLVTMARAFARKQGVSGVFHYSGAPATSWFGFACEIFAQADWITSPELVPIRSADWPTKAARPANSRLDCAKLRDAYGVGQPDWRISLAPIIAELRGGMPPEAETEPDRLTARKPASAGDQG